MTTTIVAGGGSAGACVAARLVEAGDDVILLEAGPDYGPYGSPEWPADLLDPAVLSVESHSWEYTSAASTGNPNNPLERARVIGGCSSHNGCAIVWSHHVDYDSWLARGLTQWGTDDIVPFLGKATEAMEVVIPGPDEVTPFHQIAMEALPAAGYPVMPNLMDMEVARGIFVNPVNIKHRIRWNTAFAYLDRLRENPRLRIVDHALVDNVIVRDGAAAGVAVAGPDGTVHYEADRVVLSSGSYGSPLILQRSGIADPELLAPFGIDLVHPLPGVGKHLMDHPAVHVSFSGTPELTARQDAWLAAGGLLREEGTTVLAASRRCPEAFDLHIYPVATCIAPGQWEYLLAVSVMASRSTGSICIADRHPAAQPVIDHAYFSDPDGYDLDALVDGVLIARELTGYQPLASVIGTESEPTGSARSGSDLARLIPAISKHNYHPTTSCRMGLAGDPMAVVDQDGKVHGLAGLYVIDASIFPDTTRCNTHLSTLAIAERLSGALGGQPAAGNVR